jgi:hypothetical protein
MATLTEPLAPVDDLAISMLWDYRPYVEMFAGDGTWNRRLNDAGIKCISYDLFPRGDNVVWGDTSVLSEHHETLLMVWPPDGPEIFTSALDHYAGDRAVLIGNIRRLEIDGMTGWKITNLGDMSDGTKANEGYLFERIR